MYSVFAGVYFATECQQRDREREGEGGKKEREKWMHNAIIDLAEMEMRETETEVGEEC